ncbi:MAG TPA: amidohydrolase family protein [Steroidobacteraceae bacterium]|nr:amidohydrolase family protein [Steroidobacteraceae bacterium]
MRRIPGSFVSAPRQALGEPLMRGRRAFLGCLAGTALAAALPATAAQSARRELQVGGKRAKVIDFHAHCAFPQVAELVKGTPLAREIPGMMTLGPKRIAAMDERGIDVQALSINQYWWYAAERELADKIVRMHDEALSAWCKQHPDRFVALSSVALQFPDLAAAQLEHAVRNLGLRGASVGGHVNGEVPSGPKYDAFWAKAQELDVPVFMHPGGAENIVRDGAWDGKGDLSNIIGNPLETTFFLSHLIFDGTLDRFPRLKVGAAHAGGYLPSYLGRSEVACQVRKAAACANTRKPSEYFRSQIIVDAMIFSAEGLRHLVAEVGPGQVVYGSDIPYDWPDAIDLILAERSLKDADKLAILGGNLARLLRI